MACIRLRLNSKYKFPVLADKLYRPIRVPHSNMGFMFFDAGFPDLTMP